MIRRKKTSEERRLGQVIIEFTFSMIIVFLMIYSITKIFEWSGKEIVNRRIAHDTILTGQTLSRSYTNVSDSQQIAQISPFFSSGTAMNAIWDN